MTTEEIMKDVELYFKIDTIFDDLIFSDKIDEVLFHYTTPEGFLGITKNGKMTLWFSQYDSLNDKNEGLDIEAIYKNATLKLLNKGNISDEFFNCIKNVKVSDDFDFGMCCKKNKNTTNIKTMKARCFICSFTTLDDSLAMWNSYVRNEQYNGYCIRINIKAFDELLNFPNYNSDNGLRLGNIMLYTVVYDMDTKMKYIERLVTTAYNYFNQIPIDVLKKRIQENIQRYRLAFKNKAFEHESEMRAVVYVPESNEKLSDYDKYDIKFRNKGSFIVPYIECPINDLTALEMVRVCPLINDSKVIQSIESYLDKNGFLNVEVLPSDVPIRY